MVNIKNKNILIITVVFIIAFGIGFFWGKKTNVPNFNKNQFGTGSTVNRGMRGGMNGSISGEILSKNDNWIVVKTQDGSTKLVLVGGTVTINKSTEGNFEDLSVGSFVTLFGNENTDGSVTAQNIQIRSKDFIK